MGRTRALVAPLILAVLSATVGCHDSSGPGARGSGLPGLVVSPPVSSAAIVAGTARSGGSSVVYVSLPPSSVPDGITATIDDQATGTLVTTGVLDGGFDPVAITASIGDTLLVTITRTGRAGVVRGFQVVSASRVPSVVRTSPPPGKRDVPLNAVIVVVFSTPIDTSTLTTNSVRLERGATAVPGTVHASDPTGIRVEFRPDTLLARLSDYTLTVATEIRDVNGLPLESGVTVQFTTGSVVPSSDLVFTSVTAGDYHTCGLVSSGAAYCWGANYYGELGDGTTTSSATPVAVAGGLTFTKISVGYLYTCGVTIAGTAYCWGVASTLPNSSVPATVGGGLTWSDVSVGSWYNCGITTAGAAYCWGDNSYGQLGADSATLAAAGCPGLSVCSLPVPVAGGLTLATIRAGFAATCGVTASGAAYCCDNANGELGYGSPSGPQSCVGFDESGQQEIRFPCSTTPVAVVGGLTFGSIAESPGHACGLSNSGAAYCWGANAYGELGNGTATAPDSCQSGERCTVQPTAITSGLRFASVQAGEARTCAVTAANVAYCWGSNLEGAVGDGTTTDRASPTAVSEGLAFRMIVTAGPAAGGGHSCGVTVTGVAYCWGANYYGQLGDGTATNSTVPVKVAGQP